MDGPYGTTVALRSKLNGALLVAWVVLFPLMNVISDRLRRSYPGKSPQFIAFLVVYLAIAWFLISGLM